MKVPTPRKLPSGTYYIQLRLGGESVSVTAQTASECKRQAELIKAEHRNGIMEEKSPVTNLTLRQAIDAYITTGKAALSPATIKGYTTIKRTRFKDYMDKPIKSIRNWQRIVNAESNLCSPKTLKNAWYLVGAVLRGLNMPVPKIKLPQVPPSNRPFLEPEEIKTFIAAVKGDICEIAALLALSSLRSSEITGLDWKNVDLERRRILVSGAKVMDENYKLVEKKTNKNASSSRYIPIMMDELYAALSATKEKTGAVVPWHPNTIRHRINLACESCGLPKVGTHGLRHSFVSLAYSLGVNEKTTMLIGGWGDYDTMRKIYTHLAKADIAKSETLITGFFKGNANPSQPDSASQ